MKIFHTSPNAIATIRDNRLFGRFLCFSSNAYYMSAAAHYVYEIDISEDDVIDCCRFFYREDCDLLDPIVTHVCDMFNVSQDTAEGLLSEKLNIYDISDEPTCKIAEQSWELQRLTAECAKILGYKACKMRDEQGVVYFVDAKQFDLANPKINA